MHRRRIFSAEGTDRMAPCVSHHAPVSPQGADVIMQFGYHCESYVTPNSRPQKNKHQQNASFDVGSRQKNLNYYYAALPSTADESYHRRNPNKSFMGTHINEINTQCQTATQSTRSNSFQPLTITLAQSSSKKSYIKNAANISSFPKDFFSSTEGTLSLSSLTQSKDDPFSSELSFYPNQSITQKQTSNHEVNEKKTPKFTSKIPTCIGEKQKGNQENNDFLRENNINDILKVNPAPQNKLLLNNRKSFQNALSINQQITPENCQFSTNNSIFNQQVIPLSSIEYQNKQPSQKLSTIDQTKLPPLLRNHHNHIQEQNSFLLQDRTLLNSHNNQQIIESNGLNAEVNNKLYNLKSTLSNEINLGQKRQHRTLSYAQNHLLQKKREKSEASLNLQRRDQSSAQLTAWRIKLRKRQSQEIKVKKEPLEEIKIEGNHFTSIPNSLTEGNEKNSKDYLEFSFSHFNLKELIDQQNDTLNAQKSLNNPIGGNLKQIQKHDPSPVRKISALQKFNVLQFENDKENNHLSFYESQKRQPLKQSIQFISLRQSCK